jgi:hypothetical protein
MTGKPDSGDMPLARVVGELSVFPSETGLFAYDDLVNIKPFPMMLGTVQGTEGRV